MCLMVNCFFSLFIFLWGVRQVPIGFFWFCKFICFYHLSRGLAYFLLVLRTKLGLRCYTTPGASLMSVNYLVVFGPLYSKLSSNYLIFLVCLFAACGSFLTSPFFSSSFFCTDTSSHPLTLIFFFFSIKFAYFLTFSYFYSFFFSELYICSKKWFFYDSDSFWMHSN